MVDIFLELFAETLELQAQLMADETREVISSLPAFSKSKTFLDAGCGIGSQANVLKDLLKEKNYVGVDVSKEFIELAKQRFQKETFQFFVCDILQFKPKEPFDFAFSFAVFQHLPNIKDALRSHEGFIKQGGTLVILDANSKDEFQSTPDLPELRILYRGISEEETKGKRKTNCLNEIKNSANQFHFRVVSELQGDHEIHNSTHGNVFIDYIDHVAKLVALRYTPTFNPEKLHRELSAWRNDPKAKVKLTGGSWLILEQE